MNGENVIALYMDCLVGEKLSPQCLDKLGKANTQMLRVETLILKLVENLEPHTKSMLY